MTSGGSWNTCIRQGHDRNVIVLSKCLRRAGDFFCRLDAERSRPFKAKQHAGPIARFDNAVSEQGELLVRRKFEAAFGVC